MSVINEMNLEFDSIPENEGFARVSVGAFFAQLDPTLEEVCDVKTAVSEAVTNAIIHGYNNERKKIYIRGRIKETILMIEIVDKGCGIVDVEQAMEPMFTTKSEYERAGMGFAFMEAFMDSIEVITEVGEGTTIRMEKSVRREDAYVE